MTNFDFLLTEKDFSSFASVAVAAENLLYIDRDACVLNCRRAMEFAIKWESIGTVLTDTILSKEVVGQNRPNDTPRM